MIKLVLCGQKDCCIVSFSFDQIHNPTANSLVILFPNEYKLSVAFSGTNTMNIFGVSIYQLLS